MQRASIHLIHVFFVMLLNSAFVQATLHDEVSIIHGEKTISYEKFIKNQKKYTNQNREITPPWMVSLQVFTGPSLFGGLKFEHFCGGTLIGSRWVMTSAHCVTKNDTPGFIRAQIGLTKLDRQEKQYTVASIIVHKDYIGGRKSYKNDIALIKLTEDVPDASYVQLPSTRDALNEIPHGVNMNAFGYGVTRYTSSSTSEYLRHVHLKFNRDWEGAPMLQFRAGGTGHGDTASGDSGGPLLYNNVQYGITCYGFDDLNMLSYYTNVGHYLPWIEWHTGLDLSAQLGHVRD